MELVKISLGGDGFFPRARSPGLVGTSVGGSNAEAAMTGSRSALSGARCPHVHFAGGLVSHPHPAADVARFCQAMGSVYCSRDERARRRRKHVVHATDLRALYLSVVGTHWRSGFYVTKDVYVCGRPQRRRLDWSTMNAELRWMTKHVLIMRSGRMETV